MWLYFFTFFKKTLYFYYKMVYNVKVSRFMLKRHENGDCYMTRKDARENCFKLLFEYEVQKITAEEALDIFYELTEDVGSQSEYIDLTVKTAIENIDEIDAIIEKYSKGWKISRLAKVTLAVLRVAVCELLYMDSIADSVAINEAVEIAKKYNDEKSSKFVNGVLSSVYKSKENNDE